MASRIVYGADPRTPLSLQQFPPSPRRHLMARAKPIEYADFGTARSYGTRAQAEGAASKASGGLCAVDAVRRPADGRWLPATRLRPDQEYLRKHVRARGCPCLRWDESITTVDLTRDEPVE